ncbi:putative exported repeat protein [Faustovirus]|nr:MORN repeat-containing protein [Faustovirus]AMN83122.1 putative exported repeat protein [Faustovirus]AMN84103.1 putative exported repeat protein [Faustovirus]AMN85091.1 putative exported repeat protein [Faustovirus]QBR99090.1 toxin-antitoxin system YwqK family protein [Faustovirus mariensis]
MSNIVHIGEMFPYDIVKLLIACEPILYRSLGSSNRYLRSIYKPQEWEFKRVLSTLVTKVYSRYWVLPNGARHGIWEQLDENHAVIARSLYNTGKHHGIKRKFNLDGSLHRMCIYIYGKKQIEHRYNLYGRIYSIKPYANGKLHGRVILYDSNGNVDSVVDYQNGVQWGKYIQYDYESVDVFEYVNNTRHGAYYKYTYDGRILTSGAYFNGRSDGLWCYYYDNGQLKRRVEYSHDTIMDFEVIEYWADGGIRSKSYYLDGKEISEYYRSYYPSGKLCAVGSNVFRGFTVNYKQFYEENGSVSEEIVRRGSKWVLVNYYPNGEIKNKETVNL